MYPERRAGSGHGPLWMQGKGAVFRDPDRGWPYETVADMPSASCDAISIVFVYVLRRTSGKFLKTSFLVALARVRASSDHACKEFDRSSTAGDPSYASVRGCWRCSPELATRTGSCFLYTGVSWVAILAQLGSFGRGNLLRLRLVSIARASNSCVAGGLSGTAVPVYTRAERM